MNALEGSVGAGHADLSHEPRKRLKNGWNVLGFLAIALLCVGFVSTSVNGGLLSASYYTVYADFQSVDGLKNGAEVEIAGVRVGRVARVFLAEDDLARVEMKIRNDIALPDDTIASISMRNLMGDKVVKILLGGSPRLIQPMEVLTETESGIDLMGLISNALIGSL